MTKDEALKMAIDLTERFLDFDGISSSDYIDVRDACKEALEQPTQEPVGAVQEGIVSWYVAPPKNGTLLYTHPHQWQGLTDDEIKQIWLKLLQFPNHFDISRAIEQALRSKNDS